MLKFKDGKSKEQVADELLKSYLIRCYATVTKQYPLIESMPPEKGVEHIFRLRNEGKIRISLDITGELIDCTISYIN
jgi:hypothetical protein